MTRDAGPLGRLWGFAPLLLALAVLAWAGNSVVGRAMVGTVPPMALSFWRWLFAFLVITPLAWPKLKADWRELVRRWPMVLLLGASGVAGMGALVYMGVQSTTALNSILLQASMPPVVLLFGWLLLRDRTSAGQALGVALSLLGVLAIISAGRPGELLRLRLNPGDVLILTGVLLYSGYSLLLRFRPKVHPLSLLWATFGVALVTIAPFYAAELIGGRGFAPGFKAAWGIGFVALFPSVLAYLFYNRGVELIGAGRASQFTHLMPMFGALLAVGLLGETVQLYHAVGLALIAAGIAVSTLAARRQVRAAFEATRPSASIHP